MHDRTPTPAAEKGFGLSSFTLKIIAIAGMTMDHTAYVFFPHLPTLALCLLSAFGGLTFPIMSYLLVEGYRHTSSIKRYGARLLLFAAVAQIPYSMFLARQLNVLFTLFLGLVVLYLYDHVQRRSTFWAICVLVTALSYFFDWGLIGVPMILMARALPTLRQRVISPVLLPVFGSGLPMLLVFLSSFDFSALPFALFALVGCPLSIPLLLAHDNTRGRPLKFFFYAYYPLHILVLGLVKGLVLHDWTMGYS